MSDTVTLLIGGKAHDAWEGYSIDSDLILPADDFQLTVSYGADGQLPDFVFEGARAQVMINDAIVLDGIIDTIEEEVSKENMMVELGGRDRASQLLDCSVPLLHLQNATLADIIKQAVTPLGIKAVQYKAKPSDPRQTVHTEPGQSAWEWLKAACEANQVWPWMAPDGTLVIGQPDYTSAPVATLIMRRNGDGNNVLRVRRTRSLHQVWSEVTVLGQSQGEDGEVGQNDLHGVAKDASVPLYRPHVVVDGNCESDALANRRAAKILADGKMARDKIAVTVQGHRIDDDGKLWEPGQRVQLLSEPHGIDAVYFVIKRTFTLSRNDGTQTQLHLIADGTWLLNLGFVKAKRRSDYGTRRGHYASAAGSDE
jgi:prophage tail gpP-like protein